MIVGWIASLGLAAKISIGATAAAVGVAGAGTADVLPSAVQEAFDGMVTAVTPFDRADTIPGGEPRVEDVRDDATKRVDGAVDTAVEKQEQAREQAEQARDSVVVKQQETVEQARTAAEQARTAAEQGVADAKTRAAVEADTRTEAEVEVESGVEAEVEAEVGADVELGLGLQGERSADLP
ncbi:hypothetical protein [Mycetocola sp.]|uniref:hypothetical protein n=1 Tax=Mycetocola sp. TaxID=1871042 RepID=UPI00398A0577